MTNIQEAWNRILEANSSVEYLSLHDMFLLAYAEGQKDTEDLLELVLGRFEVRNGDNDLITAYANFGDAMKQLTAVGAGEGYIIFDIIEKRVVARY